MSHLFYQTSQRRPLLDQARGVYMWDVDGKRYLDGSSGAMVCNIGHSNPNVLDAMRRQMEKSTFGYRLHFETEASEQLAARTAALCPEGMNKVFFVSGGSEAVESAIKLARQHALAIGQAGRWRVISRSPSYHGCTLGALAVTGYTPLTDPFAPMMREMPKIPAPRAYLDGLDPTDPATGAHYAAMLETEILAQGPGSVLAFIVEPIGGASTGALVPPVGYMQAVQEICRRYGVLLILDEVMTGAGRTGRFLGLEHWNLSPDIVVLSKGFAAGYVPLGAIAARDDLVGAVLEGGGFLHGFTYAGNPLACAAGGAVIDEIARLDLVQNAAVMGAALRHRLDALMTRHPIIGDVRGQGLLLAFELMADPVTKAPLPSALNAHQRLVDIAYEMGLIVYSRRTRDGVEGDHIMVCPPLIVTEAHLDEIADTLDAALTRLADELALAEMA
ncbi:aminotransferase family protein [Roseinatronobacter bogoriensis]|uniref:Aspartate aminotransferase family protein n=1 Tax=Roseinatronobacter bogoriensis subsp. barguzinensis TaxID=441209 RepID=A0A2K8KCH6_9RHOB|nr:MULTISPECIES: aspartate aminotransferase family protein [Rhodobaca]ATX67149.1 aspartate aminotransferase family protein [Rhodobaca barguzinensis]MBB4206673.1 adenosylmethionine-8-amino-7-oxononanoate aminotransferase [Rhodobaca bogoriensis DSM 18756]TDW41417.1 adenosylmethionine-8-amino-7-oxononanoate aminotransferase [Rhodobaca barguzinensis]TDY74405.1 adenosylmethionine-8-amino-7-oxononanoate aminotransferase [Rhodobaca bogoriensis DSM 18756]